MSRDLTITQAAATAGVSIDTLRFYEREGLLPPIARNAGGHRRYDERIMTWLAFALHLRATGMPLENIRLYVQLGLQGEGTVRQRRLLLEAHAEAVEHKLAMLHAAMASIRYKLDHLHDLEDELQAKQRAVPRRRPSAASHQIAGKAGRL